MTRRLAPLLALALAGCGLHPLYSGGGAGSVAATLRTVEVGPIEGQVGWLVRNKLVDRLGATGTATPQYRLDVKLDDNITGFGIRGDRAATRERRTLRARYQLVSIRQRHGGSRRHCGIRCGNRRRQLGICDGRRRADRGRAIVGRRCRPDRRPARRLRDVGRRPSEGVEVRRSAGRSTSPPPMSASICFTVPTTRSRARSASACSRRSRRASSCSRPER